MEDNGDGINIEGIGYDHNFSRELYDFFDDNLIFIKIGLDKYDWNYQIINSDKAQNIIQIGLTYDGFRDRKQAETQAFTKAFQILNERL